MSSATHSAIEAAWRIEAAKVVAHAARLVRDVGVAEELAQDALVAALEHWGRSGVPDNPGAWLMATVKNRALDRLRQDALHQRKHEELGRDLDALQAHVVPDFVDALGAAREDHIGDDLLRLVFTACHPVLPSVRGDLLARLGRMEEARAEFERAAGMTRNLRERELLLARAADPAPR